MRHEHADRYRCPYSGEPLELMVEESTGSEILTGSLRSASGMRFPIVDGIPRLIDLNRETLNDGEKKEQIYYQTTSNTYDSAIHWLFESFYEDEESVRSQIVQRLELSPHHRVLEIGCGTCCDSVHIARQLSDHGELVLQDLSPNMLAVGRKKILASQTAQRQPCAIESFVGNAAYLPFPDHCFDAAFHFGGLNLFTEKKRTLAELARVVRIGGKVVVGDESLAPWHRDTLYGNILTNANRLYHHVCPLDCLPECIRDVCVRWLLGNAFYLIEFRVAAGAPRVDLDLPIPGKRGGTLRTRYYGTLEGVDPDTKAMALRAAAHAGMSVHAWLDQVVQHAARSESGEPAGTIDR